MTLTVPEMVLNIAGEMMLADGGVVSDGGGGGVPPVATRTALKAFRRPYPYVASHPGAPRSSDDCKRMSRTCAPVRTGFADKTSAPTAATSGAA